MVEVEVASLGAYKGGDYIDFDPNPVFSFLIIYIQQQIAPNEYKTTWDGYRTNFNGILRMYDNQRRRQGLGKGATSLFAPDPGL